MNKGATPQASTIRYTVRKGPKGSVNGSTTRNGRTRKPITTPARSASAQSSGAAGFPSRTIVIITLCTLQHLFLALVFYPLCLWVWYQSIITSKLTCILYCVSLQSASVSSVWSFVGVCVSLVTIRCTVVFNLSRLPLCVMTTHIEINVYFLHLVTQTCRDYWWDQ